MSRLWTPPLAIQVDVDEAGFPIRFTWNNRIHAVHRVTNRWRADTDWWCRRIWREYFKIVTESGMLVILYHSLLDDHWYLERLYD